MEIFEQKINELIERLEALQKNPNPDFNRLKEKIDAIEYDYSKLEEGYYELREGEEALLLPMEYIEDRLLYANSLIFRICDENGLEYADYDEDDDGIIRVPLENERNCYEYEEEYNEYDVVLDKISKSALNTIGYDNKDPQSVSLMRTILLGIYSNESDDDIVGKVLAQLVLSGLIQPMDYIDNICKETRKKCKKQLFGLQIAMNNLKEFHCSAEEVLTQISCFL